MPSKAIDAWLAAAILGADHPLLTRLECDLSVADRLGQLPKAHRVRKTGADYRARAKTVSANWAAVRQRCTQAERFSTDTAQAIAGAVAAPP